MAKNSSYAGQMMEINPRTAELVADFNRTKDAESDALLSGAERRRAIVNELLDRYSAAEVADMLNVSQRRVGQLAGGIRNRKAS